MSTHPPPPHGPHWLTYVAFSFAVLATIDVSKLKRDVHSLQYKIRQLEYKIQSIKNSEKS
jgi:hypothetical protein